MLFLQIFRKFYKGIKYWAGGKKYLKICLRNIWIVPKQSFLIEIQLEAQICYKAHLGSFGGLKNPYDSSICIEKKSLQKSSKKINSSVHFFFLLSMVVYYIQVVSASHWFLQTIRRKHITAYPFLVSHWTKFNLTPKFDRLETSYCPIGNWYIFGISWIGRLNLNWL